VTDRDLLDRIPLSARRVLHIGCGDGALGAAYKQRNPRAQVLGIEADPALARLAARRLDAVASGADSSHPGPFDCLIYDAVLERLRDPQAALRRHAASLAPHGTLLARVANGDDWRIAARLLRGEWTPADDATRPLSHAAMQHLLAQAGLAPFDSIGQEIDAPAASRFTAALVPSLAALGIDRAAYLRRAAPRRVLWRAHRTPPAPLHVVATLLAPVGGVSDVRVLEPLRALASEPGVITHLSNGEDLPAIDPAAAKIFILHRPALLGAAGLRLPRRLLAQGYVVVTEFDDHPDHIPVLQHPEMHNFRAVHAVQTTTETLAAVLRAQNPEVAVFANAIRALPEPRNFNGERLTLFFGAINREADWPPTIAALNAEAARVGARLHISVMHDRGFFDALATPHKSFAPMGDYAAYLALLGAAEIAFMPLADTPFNRCKSDLKFIEAAACRAVALASPTVYGQSIEDGRTGLIFTDAAELRQKLAALLDDPARARAIGTAARRWVAERRMLADQPTGRLAWYRDLWTRRAALDAALRARVPELAG
jgi:SAM-dependent methyltransferase/glycosyltransferase involved in cell wall biosynthesis